MRVRNRQWRPLLLLLAGLQEKLFSRLEVEIPQHLVRGLRHQVLHQAGVDDSRVLAPENEGEVGDRTVWRDTSGADQDRGPWVEADLSVHLVDTEETWH